MKMMFSTISKAEVSRMMVFCLISITLYGAQSASPFKLKKCVTCTDADRARCPPFVKGPDCEEIPTPNCGCCKMCARKVGENCGVGKGFCETGLECVPPPMTVEQYKDYGPANYFLQASAGEYVCVTFEHFLDILTGVAYEQGDEAGTDQGIYIPELYSTDTGIDFGDVTEESEGKVGENHESEVIPEMQNLGHLNPFNPENTHEEPQGERSAEPPVSPFQNSPEPCVYHADMVWGKEHFDHFEWVPSCVDGYYFPEQCETSFGLVIGRCWCVDKMGNPLTKFIPREDAGPELCFPEFQKKD